MTAITQQNYVATSEHAGYYSNPGRKKIRTIMLGSDMHFINPSDRQELKIFEAERLALNSTGGKVVKIILAGAYVTSLFFAPVPTLIAGAVFAPVTGQFLDDSMYNEKIEIEMKRYLDTNPQDKRIQAFLYAKNKINRIRANII